MFITVGKGSRQTFIFVVYKKAWFTKLAGKPCTDRDAFDKHVWELKELWDLVAQTGYPQLLKGQARRTARSKSACATE